MAAGYTDLRRGIDGLAGIVQEQFQLDAFDDTLFLFCGRRSDRIKGLYWDNNGFILLYKRHPIAIKKNSHQPVPDSPKFCNEPVQHIVHKSVLSQRIKHAADHQKKNNHRNQGSRTVSAKNKNWGKDPFPKRHSARNG